MVRYFSNQCKGTAERRAGTFNTTHRCRRMTTSVTGYCPQHAYQFMSNCPTVVIGTSVKAARQYAKLMRLDDYVPAAEEKHVEGLRIRGIICTPAYLERELKNKEKNKVNFRVFYEAMERLSYHETVRG